MLLWDFWMPYRSCGRVQEAALPLCPSGNSDTLPARTQVVSGWTGVPLSMPPGAAEMETQCNGKWSALSGKKADTREFVKSKTLRVRAQHHDFHCAPARGPPVHSHTLVYYKRHGPYNLCKSQHTNHLTTLTHLIKAYFHKYNILPHKNPPYLCYNNNKRFKLTFHRTVDIISVGKNDVHII